jgi:hypothetical protein
VPNPGPYTGTGIIANTYNLASRAAEAAGAEVYGAFGTDIRFHAWQTEFQIEAVRIQAWISASRILAHNGTPCRTRHATPGPAEIYAHLRVMCRATIRSQYSPGRRAAAWVRRLGNYNEYTMRATTPGEAANQALTTEFPIRHFAVRYLLSRDKLAAFAAGQSIAHRFPTNIQPSFDGRTVRYQPIGYSVNPYPPPFNPTPAPPSQFATFTIQRD